MTTFILTDEAGGSKISLGEWVQDVRRKLENIEKVYDLPNTQDIEVKRILIRHKIDVAITDDLESPIKSDLRPTRI